MINKYKINFFTPLSLIFLFSLTVIGNAKAQLPTPIDGVIEHNDKERPCLFVANLDPEPKPLKKAWKSYLKDNYDFKIKGIGFLSNKDLLYAEDVVIEKVSSKRMNFYTYIVEDEVGSHMKVFGSFGYDIYIDKNETPEEYRVMRKMFSDFLDEYLTEYYQGELKDTEKRVKKLSKEVEGLQSDIEDNNADVKDLNEDIEDAKKEIEDLNKDTSEKEKELESASSKLENRQEKLKRVKSKLKK
ncbi:hypothetical protein CW751_04040 [Brumimicrobium salinarum]|uniref:Uncharacterized protein n=1 Tax=Brumimicrobium salinarum TaxID=2058658 RepID=A0A2I0R571_9FLAO|nr:hypothetical protein [Brumimicrobium salinarum]PKR81705.1 hypothetical protein CW751_04040 [Brumimicrobium salinarum]